jgi:hypothetical protein
MKKTSLSLAIGLALSMVSLGAMAQNTTFGLVRSAATVAANCIPNARARVTINSLGGVEVMHMEAFGLPANTGFDAFVIQLPNAPFGLSWYQGDLKTDANGTGVADFIGRFSIETFIVAPGSGAAPVVFTDTPFPDVNSNPPTGPVHTYHVGLWFDSPNGAAAAGCPNTVTPFNGEHNAGVQALSSRGFGDLNGPLRRIK